MNRRGGSAVVVSAMLLMACGSPDVPQVSPRQEVVVDDDDRAVMRAVLDDVVRSGSAGPVRFLVVEQTAAYCDVPPSAYYPRLPGCVGPQWLEHLKQFKVAFPLALSAIFHERNRRSVPIRGSLGADVVYIPGQMNSNTEFSSVMQQQAPGAAVVIFSVPAYVDGSAFVAYRHLYDSGGFVRLRRSEGSWKPVERRAWVE